MGRSKRTGAAAGPVLMSKAEALALFDSGAELAEILGVSKAWSTRLPDVLPRKTTLAVVGAAVAHGRASDDQIADWRKRFAFRTRAQLRADLAEAGAAREALEAAALEGAGA